MLDKSKLPTALQHLLVIAEKKVPIAPVSLLALCGTHAFCEFAGFFQPKIYGAPVIGKPAPVNMYSMAFLRSGGGKDSAMSFMRLIYKPFMDEYQQEINDIVDQRLEELQLEAQRKGLKGKAYMDYVDKRALRRVALIYNDGTYESLPKIASTVAALGRGSLNYSFSEFMDYLNNNPHSPFLTLLKTSYDDGYIQAKSTKGQDEVINVQATFNVISYATMDNVSRVLDKQFRDQLVGGYGRRFLMIYPSDSEYRKQGEYNPDTDAALDSYLQAMQSAVAGYKSMFEKHNMFKFSEESRVRLTKYNASNDDKAMTIIDTSGAALCNEMRARAWRASKISALFHMMDMSPKMTDEEAGTISIKSVEQAIYFVEYCAEHYIRFAETPKTDTDIDLLYKFLKKNLGKTLTMADITKQPFIGNRNIRSFLENNVPIIDDLARQELHVLETIKSGRSFAVRLTEMSDVKDITLSVSNTTSDDKYSRFSPWTIDWQDLPNLVTGGKFFYSPFTYINNKRTQANSSMTISVVIFDVDGGLSLAEAKQTLSTAQYHIITTQSHQKEKNGVKCDRFRIFLKVRYTMTFESKDHYKTVMENIANYFAIPIDIKCSETARMFFDSPHDAIVITNETGETINFSMFEKKIDIVSKVTHDAQIVSQPYESLPVDAHDFRDRIKRWLDKNFIKNNRNNALYSAKLWAKQGFIPYREVREFLTNYNNNSGSPLSDVELAQCLREE